MSNVDDTTVTDVQLLIDHACNALGTISDPDSAMAVTSALTALELAHIKLTMAS